MKRILSFFFIVIVVLQCFTFAEKIQDLSFEGPFTEIDYSGERMVSRMWRVGGSTVVQNNFVRITPDRQSQKGALWSRRAVGVSQISAILKLRISGKGKQFFGDGMAMWIATQGYYVEGDLHGFTENFTGIGIIFDTFKNQETIDTHRDVTIVVNDGTKTYAMMTEDVQGCNINVRYHAERADFNAQDSITRAKFLLHENSIDLFIDAQNTGEWTRCAQINIGDMPYQWLQHSHIGISASTGQLSDNHDIISLQTYSDVYKMEMDQKSLLNAKVFQTDITQDVDYRVLQIESAVESLMKQARFLDHHIEHELTTLEDQVDQLKSKLDHLINPPKDDADGSIEEGMGVFSALTDDHSYMGGGGSSGGLGYNPSTEKEAKTAGLNDVLITPPATGKHSLREPKTGKAAVTATATDGGVGATTASIESLPELVRTQLNTAFGNVDAYKKKIDTLQLSVASMQRELVDSKATSARMTQQLAESNAKTSAADVSGSGNRIVKDGSWKIPFLILVFLYIGALVLGYIMFKSTSKHSYKLP